MIRRQILRWLVEKLKQHPEFLKFIRSQCHEYYMSESLHYHRIWGDESRLVLGEQVQINNATINTVSGVVTIGDYSFLGHNVSLLTGTHDYTSTGIARQISVPATGRDIVIGNGVWIASNVTVLGPCVIGDNAVIGAGSVVSGSIDEGCVYAGCPARKVRSIALDG